MIVAFDAICLGDGPVTGVARAFLNGLHAYAEQWARDAVVLVPAGAPAAELPDVRRVAAPRGAWRRQLALPGLLRELRADVLHSSVVAVPLRAPCPTIATAHDLPWMHPESGERSTFRRRFATGRALRAATAVIAPSRFTLAAAARIRGSRDGLHHVPHTTPPPAARTDATPRTGPLLVLGDDRPRKNRAAVREAHRLASRRDPGVPPLRFAGPPDGWVSEADKAELLRTCRAVVSCSRYEGFGMPVLEALVHGAPLVCSDIPPHREIVDDLGGRDAVFVDPRSPDSIARGLLAVLAAPPPPPVRPPRIAERWRVMHERPRPDSRSRESGPSRRRAPS